jgi:hypothetical protein
VQNLGAIRSCFMSLKTKGFSRETEAFLDDGGGETRTLVLSELPIKHYMLSVQTLR